MTRPNRPDLGALPEMPPAEIAALPAEILALLQRDSEAALSAAKTTRARLDAALELRYAERAAAARRAAGKDTGTVRLEDDGVTVVADLPKRVDWDQAQLARIVERIRATGDDPDQYVDVAIKVPERNYAAWPRTIRQVFEPARTVRPGTLKIELRLEGGAA